MIRSQHSRGLNYLQAELWRSYRWLTMWLPVFLVGFAVVSAMLSTVVNASRIASLHFYAVAILAPIAALTAVLSEIREQRLREGGLIWRHLNYGRVLLARLLVVAIYSGIGHVLMAALVASDIATAGQFVLANTVAFIGMWTWGLALWALLGRAATVVAPIGAIGWSVAGIFSATAPSWPLLPWAWLIRPTLPVYGVLPNSIAASATSPIWDIDIYIPLLLQAFLGALLFILALALYPRRRRQIYGGQAPGRLHFTGRARPRTPRRGASVSSSISAGLAQTLPWRIWTVLAVILLVAVVGLRALRGSEVATAAVSFFAIPTAATIVAVMTVTSQSQAWPGLQYRRVRRRLYFWLFILDLGFLASVLVLAMGIAAVDTGSESSAGWIYQLMVTPAVAALILAVVGALARYSTSAAIVISIALTAWSVLIGGDALNSGPLWWTSAWSWSWTVRDYPQRWVAVVLLSAAVVAVIVLTSTLKSTRVRS